MKGQTFLREQVFSRVERQILAVKEGRIGELSVKDQRKARNRIAWAKGQEESAAEVAEAEVEKSSLGQWATTKDAVGEVEKEIEVDEATKAFGLTEISQKKLWESDLADRTK